MLYRIEVRVKNLLRSTVFKRSETTRVTPLIPKPSKAMLIIIKAKWYHKDIDKTLIIVNSSIKELKDIKRRPILCL
jgi:hypothetical protein